MLQDCIFHRFQRSESELRAAAPLEISAEKARYLAENIGNWTERNELSGKTNHILEETRAWG